MTASNGDGTGGPPVIAVATHRQAPVATADDALAFSIIAGRSSARIEIIPWDTPSDWGRYAAVIIRSTWDYHRRLDPFLRWAEAVEASGAALWNPARVIRWNADKRYLRELQEAGVAVVPTEWVRRGSRIHLGAMLERRGWKRAVTKPSVGATAYRTGRAGIGDLEEGTMAVAKILEDADALIQPFLPEVCREGEWSFMYFDDGAGSLAFSHAVVKRPRAGDFRVQDEFGGTAEEVVPPSALLRQASQAAGAVARIAPGPLLYARLDGVVSDGTHAPEGTFLLMEAELIEPMLFLAHSARGADLFAQAVARRIGSSQPRSSLT